MECTFCKFINGDLTIHNDFSNHGIEFPFIPVYETENTLTFLSVPNARNESDLLLIPKNHYKSLTDIPEEILTELSKSLQKIISVIRKNYGDCKVLLNEGKNADQYVFHVHFHIIPKDEKREPIWKISSLEQFEKLSNDLTNLLK